MEMCLQSSLHQKVCSVYEYPLVIIYMDLFYLLWILDLDKGLIINREIIVKTIDLTMLNYCLLRYCCVN